MQRLVSVCLTSSGAAHGTVEEHLADYLNNGWRIISITAAGGSASPGNATVWIAAVIEKPGN